MSSSSKCVHGAACDDERKTEKGSIPVSFFCQKKQKKLTGMLQAHA